MARNRPLWRILGFLRKAEMRAKRTSKQGKTKDDFADDWYEGIFSMRKRLKMLLTPAQFAEQQGQSLRTIQRRMRSGELEFTRPVVGRRARYIDSDQLCPEPIPEPIPGPIPRVAVSRGPVVNPREIFCMCVLALATLLACFLYRKGQTALERRRSQKVQSPRKGFSPAASNIVYDSAPIPDYIAQVIGDLS